MSNRFLVLFGPNSGLEIIVLLCGETVALCRTLAGRARELQTSAPSDWYHVHFEQFFCSIYTNKMTH
jgi:hypothetical protein